jgi:hypothetical protein
VLTGSADGTTLLRSFGILALDCHQICLDEHGWCWLNYSKFGVQVTHTVAGCFDDVVDHGIF